MAYGLAVVAWLSLQRKICERLYVTHIEGVMKFFIFTAQDQMYLESSNRGYLCES